MEPSLPALLPHPVGEQPLVEEFSATAETFAGRVHVEVFSIKRVIGVTGPADFRVTFESFAPLLTKSDPAGLRATSRRCLSHQSFA